MSAVTVKVLLLADIVVPSNAFAITVPLELILLEAVICCVADAPSFIPPTPVFEIVNTPTAFAIVPSESSCFIFNLPVSPDTKVPKS